MARFNGGWVKIYREVLNSDIGKHPTRFSLFMHLIAMANIEESWVDWKGKPRRCPRGSLVTSLRELSKVTGADTKMIERQLRYLALRDTLGLEPDTRGTFITVNNYSDYQDKYADAVTVPTHGRHGDDVTDGDTDRDSNEESKNKELRIKNSMFEIAWNDFKKISGVVKGPKVELNFEAQIKTPESFADLQKSIANYQEMLATPENAWRKPKGSFASFLGTKRSGFYWHDFINWVKPEPGQGAPGVFIPQADPAHFKQGVA